MPAILHDDWSNRSRTAFRRWTQAVHQVAAIQVGRHRFLACSYRFLAAKKQAKADLSSGHSNDRIAFESFAPDISEQPDPSLTDLFDTCNYGSQRLSARYQHTQDVVVTRTHTHATRDKGMWGGLLLPCMQRVISVEVYVFWGVLKGNVTRLCFFFQPR